ncbi:MAG: dephospho-CoA kinase [bacterium]
MRESEPLLIGLTGGPGAGKSTVAQILASKGAAVISGDELGRRALRRFPELKEALRRRYGDSLFTARGVLKRRALGQIVFRDKREVAWLNHRMFPKIYELLREDIKRLGRTHSIIVVDAAMIFEWGIEKDFDLVWVVIAPQELAERRMVRTDRLSSEEIRQRLRFQIPPHEKARRAQSVIRNSGSRRELRRIVERAWTANVLPRLAQKTRG